MSFLINYKNFEKNVYIPKNNDDFSKKYKNVKKIKVNIFARTFKFLGMVAAENLNNKGVGYSCKMKKKILYQVGSCNNNKVFQKVYPGIKCSLDDMKKQKYTEYVWNYNNFDGLTIFVDADMNKVVDCNSKYKVSILAESKFVNPKIYNMINKYEKYFDLILTHDKLIFDKYPNKTIIITASPSILDWHEMNLFKKTKLISFPTSSKLVGLEGYVLRGKIKNNIENKSFSKNIDTFGTGFNKPFISKSVCLKDYMFSICLENSKYDYYVTEKIFDVIMSGCVPIYWGMPSISKVFDPRGMFVFNNIEELNFIIDSLTEDKYYEMLPYVEKNFNIAKKFVDWDDNVIKTCIDRLGILI